MIFQIRISYIYGLLIAIIMSIGIITLNVQGFLNVTKQINVMQWAKTQKCDLLFLQETNVRTFREMSQFRNRFQVECYFAFGSARSEGVAVINFSPTAIKDLVVKFDLNGRVIVTDMFVFGLKVRSINVYAPARAGACNPFFRELDVFLLDPKPFFLLGDFNCVLDSQRDVRGPGFGRSTHIARELKRIVEQYTLHDAWVYRHGNQFQHTWSRRQSFSRLDRFYFQEQTQYQVTDCQVLNLPDSVDYVTDHLPLFVEIAVNKQDQAGPQLWRLDSSLLRDTTTAQELEGKIRHSILEIGQGDTSWDELKLVWQSLLIAASKEKKRKETSELRCIWKKMQIVKRGGAATLAMQEYLELQKERYFRVMRRSARITSMANNKNRPVRNPQFLRYMHNEHFRQKSSGIITQVKMPNGILSTSQTDIEQVFVTYFEKLFESKMNEVSEAFHDSMVSFLSDLPQVPTELTESLCQPVRVSEVKTVIDKMKTGTAPGEDGLTVEFFKRFFKEIAPTLVDLINDFLRTGRMPESFKRGRIVLIPKGGEADPGDPRSWRPITLLNTDRKIIASLLASRLKEVLPYIVSPFQTSSVPGRSIFSALHLVRDIIAYTKDHLNVGLIVSWDQAKAFDCIEYVYLYNILQSFGFPDHFVLLLRALYTDSQCGLLVNRMLSRQFRVSRGVRQGCPLSPMLFCLCIDPLLRKLNACRNIRGLPLPGIRTVAATAYADDIVLYLRDVASLQSAFLVFEQYSRYSGATLNKDKSKVLSLGEGTGPIPDAVQSVSSMTLIGVIFDKSGVATENWNILLKQVEKEVLAASKFQLSFQERAYLVKSKFCAKLWFVARIARPPIAFCTRLTSQCFRFFWNGSTELVTREVLRLPRAEGGWGMPCISTVCMLLAMRNVLQMLEDVDCVGRPLILYFLGPHRRVLIPRALGNLAPSAEVTPPFYLNVLEMFRAVREKCPDIDLNSTPVSRICEQLCARRDANPPTVQNVEGNWEGLTSKDLPSDVQDFMWKAGRGVLPTRDRLNRWGVTNETSCPNCGALETNRHALQECVRSRTFKRLLSRRLGVPTSRRRRHSRLEALISAVALFVVWHGRCVAVARRRRYNIMFPSLIRVKKILVGHLESELYELGETEFLRRWGTRYIKVMGNAVVLSGPQL